MAARRSGAGVFARRTVAHSGRADGRLDARSELEVFERFAELTKDKMALLISHRFSTVRMADRIVVLSGGQLVEQGNHKQLMALGGRYAEMFEMQAASYR